MDCKDTSNNELKKDSKKKKSYSLSNFIVFKENKFSVDYQKILEYRDKEINAV